MRDDRHFVNQYRFTTAQLRKCRTNVGPLQDCHEAWTAQRVRVPYGWRAIGCCRLLQVAVVELSLWFVRKVEAARKNVLVFGSITV